MYARTGLLAAALVAAGAAAAQAPEVRSRSIRNYDVSIGATYIDSESTGFDGGTVVDNESATGFSFAFDYYFKDRWSVGATATGHTIDYVADVAAEGPLGQPGQRVVGELESTSLIGHTKRYFGDFDRLEPYASVGLGIVSVDTNIPEGPAVGVCWWHPWWGYVCDSVQPTRTTSEATMTLGFGVRVELGRRLFFDGSVGRQWIDFDTANRPGYSQLRLAIGLR
jgi:opacity protein-like surface antigen